MTPEKFDELRDARFKWPWRKMAINDVIEVTGMHSKTNQEIRRHCHAYGTMTKKKFETLKIDGKLYVKRVA